MKNLFKFSFVLLLANLIMVSCSTDDKVTDIVQDNATQGAVLRALNDTEDNDPIIQGAGNTWTVQLEEQDNQEGALMQQVNVYVRFDDTTVLSAASASGAGTDLSFPADGVDPDDVLLRSLAPSDFTTDTPFGLPRTDLVITEADLAAVLDTSSWNSTDVVRVRLELVLTDGRIFSINNAGGIITGFGSYFSSPFQHRIELDAGIGINYLDEDNNFYTPGFTNNYFVLAEITDQDMGNNIQTVNVYKRFTDTTLEGADISIPEELVESFTTFGTSPDGFPTINVAYDEAGLLDFPVAGITLDEDNDLAVGDSFAIRYEVITNDGRTITNENSATDFYDVISVTDCPFPPLDETTSFVGDYLAEQIVPTIFGYDTFDPDGGGVILTLSSVVTPATAAFPGFAMNDNQRSFDGSYIAALGFGNIDTYVMEFNLCQVTISADAGPLDGSTGVTCTQANIIQLGPIEGGVYNAEDDTEFILIFDEDLLQDCGIPNQPQIRFTKQ